MHKLRFDIVAQVVVAKELIAADLMRNSEPPLLKWLLVQVVADPNSAGHDEVHFKDLLLLIKNDVFVLLLTEVSGHETECNFVQKFTVFVLLGIEENPEVVEYIIK